MNKLEIEQLLSLTVIIKHDSVIVQPIINVLRVGEIIHVLMVGDYVTSMKQPHNRLRIMLRGICHAQAMSMHPRIGIQTNHGGL